MISENLDTTESEPRRGCEKQPLKDHEIAVLVNKLTSIAKEYHNHQSLREIISQLVVKALKGTHRV